MNTKGKVSGGGSDRDARLKQALKANLQRRKAQARARAAGDDPEQDIEGAAKGAPGEAKQDG